jgi:hypothetical protein
MFMNMYKNVLKKNNFSNFKILNKFTRYNLIMGKKFSGGHGHGHQEVDDKLDHIKRASYNHKQTEEKREK